jgi:MoaA/NifB/PqqE/SkfB family radical SAM enzyme
VSKYGRRLEQWLAGYAALLLVRILPRLAASGKLKEALVAFTTVARAIPREEHRRVQLEQLREAFRSDHAALKLAQRAVAQLHPKFLLTIIRNLWMPLWVNGEVRQRFIVREGFRPPSLAVISPLKECNLQCEGCYASAETKKQEQRLDFETMDRIVTEIKSFGTPFVVISGGEPTHPLIWPTLKKLCAKHSDMAFMMYTNGTLLDDKKVQDLLELGNLSPAISVEGWREETDDRRGSGVYDKVMAAMDRLRDAGVFFGFSLTYTSKNFEAATNPRFIDHLMGKGCVYGWYFMYVPVGKDPDTGLVVTPWQRDKIRRFTWEVLRTRGLFIADFWNSGPMSLGCIAGGRYLHVNNKGDIEPCVFFKFTTHNIKDSRLIDALRSPLFREIRRAQEKQCNPLTPCQFMDHPCDGKRAVAASGARASEEGGEGLFGSKIYPFLERWSAEYAEHYAAAAWRGSGDYAWFSHVYSEPRWLAPAVCPLGEVPRTEEKATADIAH